MKKNKSKKYKNLNKINNKAKMLKSLDNFIEEIMHFLKI
jgi:hypothetical protein